MNKSQLTGIAAERLDLEPKTVAAVYTEIVTLIEQCLTQGERVTLVGFGTFEAFDAAARTAHDPNTQQLVQVPARRRMRFRPSAALRENINTARR